MCFPCPSDVLFSQPAETWVQLQTWKHRETLGVDASDTHYALQDSIKRHMLGKDAFTSSEKLHLGSYQGLSLTHQTSGCLFLIPLGLQLFFSVLPNQFLLLLLDIVLRTFNSVQCFMQPQAVFEIIFSPLQTTVTVFIGDVIITQQKGVEITDSKLLSEAVGLFQHTPHMLFSVPCAN